MEDKCKRDWGYYLVCFPRSLRMQNDVKEIVQPSFL